ncbi:PREDICTED: alkylated DNA repair protein alkB homolog 1 [Bison bison bison]|uniref:Nucleic acid dioxygenase ALKBH1 n=5 Tax=Bovinae TaxID=27592 RepID=F6RQT4_BOVIN|nr:nucleic acid dioxygenase ALKBH1 isoform X1 [Bos taurus]XP_005908477.1 PREDICTED: alkylated DNA repair protein alkB homolog 1 [Bos mutus]XP_010842694.1 PREDICTED: alkylated DNA repair protein alkB homolog 1 [Bison bison bison]ELR47118.1 Alkylated DNA repair protein alkB-like protein 1 [Bos mutus]
MGKMAAAVGSVATLAVQPGEDAFRKLFRFYRQSRPGTADLEGVIDFSVSHAARGTGPGAPKVVKSQLNLSSVSDHDALRAGLEPVSKWQAYGLQGYPGFIFISNPFLPGYQWHWVKQCLKLYSRKPNVCNLDKHMTKEETQDLWEQSKEFLRCKEVNKRRPRSLLEKLRWVTLGYHYNWDNKRYSADHYTPFPSDLAFLSEQVAAACGFQGFRAEAGILNYYRLDSTLGIHVDRSELDHSRPLLSFSFGQSAIFLLGGLKRDEAPTPMFMHSGDIMVMSGFSRLVNHAVPRVLPSPEGESLPGCLRTPLPADLPRDSVVDPCSVEDWQVCASYLKTARVNMTVRQVLAVGQDFPLEPMEENKRDIATEGSCHLDDDNSQVKRARLNPDC